MDKKSQTASIEAKSKIEQEFANHNETSKTVKESNIYSSCGWDDIIIDKSSDSENKNETINPISYQQESWDDEDEYDDFDDDATTEIKLFDFDKSKEENLETGSKFILFEVKKDGFIQVHNPEEIISLQSKCVVNLSKFESFSELEFMPVAYNSFMGVEVTNFLKYDSNFFTCDERVMFITLLVKYKCFDFKPFFWSKKVIFEELGIKKDRATKILKRFEELGILSSEVVKSMIANRPQQITYYDLDTKKVIDLLPKIIKNYEKEECELIHDIENYLKPAIKPIYKSKSMIMQ